MKIKPILLAAIIVSLAGIGCASTGGGSGDGVVVDAPRGVCSGTRQRTTGSRIASTCSHARSESPAALQPTGTTPATEEGAQRGW